MSLNPGLPALRRSAGRTATALAGGRTATALAGGLPVRHATLDITPAAGPGPEGPTGGTPRLPRRPRRGEGGQAGDIGPMPRRRRPSARPRGRAEGPRPLTEVERVEALIRGGTDVGPMSLRLPLRRRAALDIVLLAFAVAGALAWAGTTLDLLAPVLVGAAAAAVGAAAAVLVAHQPTSLRADAAGLRLGSIRIRWDDLGGLSVSSRLTGLLRRRVLTITTRHGFEHHVPAVNLGVPPEDAIGAIVGWCQSRGIDTDRWFLLRFPDRP